MEENRMPCPVEALAETDYRAGPRLCEPQKQAASQALISAHASMPASVAAGRRPAFRPAPSQLSTINSQLPPPPRQNPAYFQRIKVNQSKTRYFLYPRGAGATPGGNSLAMRQKLN